MMVCNSVKWDITKPSIVPWFYLFLLASHSRPHCAAGRELFVNKPECINSETNRSPRMEKKNTVLPCLVLAALPHSERFHPHLC